MFRQQSSWRCAVAARGCTTTAQLCAATFHPSTAPNPLCAAAVQASWVTAAAAREDNSTRSFSSRDDRDEFAGRGSSRGGRGDFRRGGQDSSSGRGGGSSSWSRDSSGRGGRDSSSSSSSSSNRGGRAGRGGGRSWEQPQERQQQQWQQQQPRQQPYRQQADDWQDDDDDNFDGDYDGEFQYPARPSRASILETVEGDALYGVAPVLAALSAGIRRPYALLMQEGLSASGRKDARAVSEIKRLAAAAGAEFKTMSKHDLNMLSGNRPHQGLILDASPLIWREMDQLPHVDDLQRPTSSMQPAADEDSSAAAGEASSSSSSSGQAVLQHPVWLALDEVVDPQNLGAMLRSAYCLGVAGVLACSRNCAPLSPVVSKASAGAMELMALHSCKSMPRTLSSAVDNGWAVIGAAAEEGAVPLAQLKIDRPTMLVMGNEGYGVRPLVKRICTQLVQIEMTPGGATQQQLQLVDSLNVSVATGILLHQMVAAARQ